MPTQVQQSPTAQVSIVIGNPAGPPGTAGASITPRGDWTTATAYAYRDVVSHDGASYLCRQSHTSGASSEPGTGGSWATYWQVLASGSINDAATSTATTWSSDQISTQLATKAAASHTHNASDINAGTLADARVAASNVTQHVGSIDHNALANYDAAQHRSIDDGSSAATALWSASKIGTELAAKANTTHTHDASAITSGSIGADRIPAGAVTQHEALIDHGNLSGLVGNDHPLHLTNAVHNGLFTSPGTPFAVPAQNTITGAHEGNGLLKLVRSANGTTLPPNTALEMCTLYDGAALIGGWLIGNGDQIGDSGVVTPDTSHWYWNAPLVIGSNGSLWLQDQREVRWYEAASNGDYYIAERAPADLSGSYTYTKPTQPGAAGSFLTCGHEGATNGQQRWEQTVYTGAFPTTNLYTGRRITRSDLGDTFTYYANVGGTSPPTPGWVGDETLTIGFGKNQASVNVTQNLNAVGNMNPTGGVQGYGIDVAMVVTSLIGHNGTSFTGTLDLTYNGSIVAQATYSASQSAARSRGPSNWVAVSPITGAAFGADMTYSSGNILDPVATATLRRFIAA